jgi:hypothetical protein
MESPSYIRACFPIISQEIANNDYSLVYIAVGSAMGQQSINNNNNQQFPPFIRKVVGKKLVILIDPVLELNLAIQQYLNENHDPLNIVLNEYVRGIGGLSSGKRVLKNDNVTVIAINDRFNYDEECSPLLEMIITTYLPKVVKPKVVLQDFIGIDTTPYYVALFNKFSKTELLKNVIFDVTQKHGSCSPNLSESMLSFDADTNIIQEKYMPLSDITQSPMYQYFIQERIKSIVYPVNINYINIINNYGSFVPRDEQKMLMLFYTYGIYIDTSITSYDYVISKYVNLIFAMIQDIIIAKGLPDLFYDEILNVVHDRDRFMRLMNNILNNCVSHEMVGFGNQYK